MAKGCLIIDDNYIVATIISQLLRHERSRKVAVFDEIIHKKDANESLKAITSRKFELIFLDLSLSRPLDGISLLSQIQQLTPETPVIIISGETDASVVKEVLIKKPLDYIVKPISLRKVITGLNQYRKVCESSVSCHSSP
ncbi:response regulator [Photobacterium atrarenae]|uniref:Response regulator n=1 Tax=Photobacterium atrarenae TaxID=865757 RepID=A0ABY5GPG5_9GAMM|nr:response regulator [Photobacterium atrarenae]UTV30990.1 response regulator [Photobacterium atrarenae]